MDILRVWVYKAIETRACTSRRTTHCYYSLLGGLSALFLLTMGLWLYVGSIRDFQLPVEDSEALAVASGFYCPGAVLSWLLAAMSAISTSVTSGNDGSPDAELPFLLGYPLLSSLDVITRKSRLGTSAGGAALAASVRPTYIAGAVCMAISIMDLFMHNWGRHVLLISTSYLAFIAVCLPFRPGGNGLLCLMTRIPLSVVPPSIHRLLWSRAKHPRWTVQPSPNAGGEAVFRFAASSLCSISCPFSFLVNGAPTPVQGLQPKSATLIRRVGSYSSHLLLPFNGASGFCLGRSQPSSTHIPLATNPPAPE